MAVSVTFLRKSLTTKAARMEFLSLVQADVVYQIGCLNESPITGKALKLLIESSCQLVQHPDFLIISAFLNFFECLYAFAAASHSFGNLVDLVFL